MKITLNVAAERIADMMVTAIESSGMTRAWCKGVYLISAHGKRVLAGEEPSLWYAEPKLYAGERFTVEIHESSDERGGEKHRRNAADFAKGIALMAERYGAHFGDMMAVTGDVFLQCIALGELRYG